MKAFVSVSPCRGGTSRKMPLPSSAALAAVGADLKPAVAALAGLAPPSGRGSRIRLRIDGGEALLIDESYNANPASMRAALATLGAVPRQKFLRRIAVLGDMLELGEGAPQLHIGLKEAVDEAGVDLIFACGRHMKGLYDALPEAKKGSYALTAASLEEYTDVKSAPRRRRDGQSLERDTAWSDCHGTQDAVRGRRGSILAGIAAYTGEVSSACSMSSSISAIRSAR